MKKSGFTLGEVLIALAIVGVVASITIPTFTSNNQKRANEAKLITAVNAIENAFTTMLAKEVAVDLTEVDAIQKDDGLISELEKHLKLTSSGQACFRLKSGVEVCPEANKYTTDMDFKIDVNGFSNVPNKVNVDQFTRKLKDSGELVE
jgi:prepilin-type N-terminal cleavage/methylation domain-containing protein